jgi:hypothetical protein
MIGLRIRRGCAGHRTALLDFATHRAGGPEVLRALDHVDRCRTCEDELAMTTLVLHALRRLHEETMRAEPAADGWGRLRARLAATRREPSRLLSGLPGIALAFGLCAALVGPSGIVGGGSTRVYNEAPRGVVSPSIRFEQSREHARRAGLLPVPAPAVPYTGARTAPPPIALDLPLAMRREVAWIEEIVEPAPVAVATGPSGVTQQGQAGRR